MPSDQNKKAPIEIRGFQQTGTERGLPNVFSITHIYVTSEEGYVTQVSESESTFLCRPRRQCQSSRGDSAEHCAKVPAGARPGSCSHWRGAKLPGPSHLPTVPVSSLREGIHRAHWPPSLGEHRDGCPMTRAHYLSPERRRAR